jgi:hypothetical protein
MTHSLAGDSKAFLLVQTEVIRRVDPAQSDNNRADFTSQVKFDLISSDSELCKRREKFHNCPKVVSLTSRL